MRENSSYAHNNMGSPQNSKVLWGKGANKWRRNLRTFEQISKNAVCDARMNLIDKILTLWSRSYEGELCGLPHKKMRSTRYTRSAWQMCDSFKVFNLKRFLILPALKIKAIFLFLPAFLVPTLKIFKFFIRY